MELLQQAATCNDFGLRKCFPWSKRCAEDIKPKIDCRSISLEEKLYVFSTLGNQVPSMNDTFIGRIENPYLWSRYLLQYEEMQADPLPKNVSELIVIHATSLSCAYEIADNNFDWRLVKRYRYGQGVSFAKDVNYAAQQATQNDAYIIAGILVSSSKVGNYGTFIPPGSSDTTTNYQKSVYVKYYDSDFYPYYIVH